MYDDVGDIISRQPTHMQQLEAGVVRHVFVGIHMITSKSLLHRSVGTRTAVFDTEIVQRGLNLFISKFKN